MQEPRSRSPGLSFLFARTLIPGEQEPRSRSLIPVTRTLVPGRMWTTAKTPMNLTTDLKPTTGFTKVLNSVVFNNDLTPYEFQLWVRLLAAQEGRDRTPFTSISELATAVGLTVDLLRKRKQQLRRKGFVEETRGHIHVTIPDENFVPEPEKEQTIAQEEADKPRRESTGLSQADRKTLIKEAWNKYKPDWCAPISGSMAPPLYIAIEAQTKHLEHDRDDYDGFFKKICAALAASRFWRDEAKKPVKAHGVFGWGTPDDKKFRNCKTLYMAADSREVKATLWNAANDQDWLDWFHEKGFTSFTKVERFVVKDRIEAFTAERDKPESSDTIRVYQSEDGLPYLWTNDSHRALVSSKLPSNS